MADAVVAEDMTYDALLSKADVCPLCGYEIINPTCLGCLRKEVMKLTEKDVVKRSHVNSTISRLKRFTTNNTRCVNCKRKVNVCKYCFKNQINNTLRNNHVNTINDKKFKLTPEFQFLY